MNTESEWIYINNTDNTARYVLGTKGKKTLFCFGINPSIATPETPDPTIRKVQSIAENNGYDSFIMFNVYPVRDTDFNKLENCINDIEHLKNIEIIIKIISGYSEPDIWIAFGNHIADRKYLPVCFKDIYNRLPANARWLTVGVNKNGTPKHPLYQKKTAQLVDFNMSEFIKSI